MEQESNIHKRAEKFANIMDSWWKIISIFGLMIFFIYEISVVWFKITQMEKDVEIMKKELNNSNDNQDEKFDKKIEQIKEILLDLQKRGIQLTMDFQHHLVEDAKDKGVIKEDLKWLEKNN